tara:strand:- start:27 stop:635 length:609 start_codon:yes stop_codon:yes gene_type:complete
VNTYNFFYWGPLLFRIKLEPKDLKKCAELCSKKSSEVNDELVGMIKHEHYVSTNKYYKVLEPYLNSFRHGYEKWYGKLLTQTIIMNKAWVNFMTAGEYNPPHTHSDCAFSSVLFIQVPQKLEKENKDFGGYRTADQSATEVIVGPGTLSFTYGESQPYSLSCKNFLPVVGDLFIFPASLTHFASPFRSAGERISMSANFRLE